MDNRFRTFPAGRKEKSVGDTPERGTRTGERRRGLSRKGERGRERKRNYQRSMTEFPAVFSVRPAAFTAR